MAVPFLAFVDDNLGRVRELRDFSGNHSKFCGFRASSVQITQDYRDAG
jgi:hypothetical protein